MKNINILISIILHHFEVKLYCFETYVHNFQLFPPPKYLSFKLFCIWSFHFYFFKAKRILLAHGFFLGCSFPKISLQTFHFSLACNDMVFLGTIKYLLLLEWQCH